MIFSDGDPLYTSRNFKRFCEVNEIEHDFSSAHYPQSNGQSERAIQHIKNILSKCVRDNTDFKKALLMYRNTPLGDSLKSPAMMLLNRNLRTNVPCLDLNSANDHENRIKLQNRQVKAKEYYDKNVRKNHAMNIKKEILYNTKIVVVIRFGNQAKS